MDEFGYMTADTVSRQVKEAVIRAIEEINQKRFDFEAKQKVVDYKKEEDFVTSADISAQRIYTQIFKESFPDYGIIGEEDNLRKEPGELGLWFTVDPLDGTKAFIRKQSHGVATMVALVKDKEIIGVWIGDVFTKELYYYRPKSDKVHRLINYKFPQRLGILVKKPLKNQVVVLRTHPRNYSKVIERMTLPGELFKDINIDSGSIGTMFGRLWKGEVGALILQEGKATPWDRTPIIGISKKLGFQFLSRKKDDFVVFNPDISMEIIEMDEHIIVHEKNVPDVIDWFREFKKVNTKI
jgi:fructose-1,6-bisphosphatase/inositol monophosphatase family enzyme